MSAIPASVTSQTLDTPSDLAPLTNIAQLLLRAAMDHLRSGVRLLSPTREGEAVVLNYAALLEKARCILGGLQAHGHAPGATVALLLERPADIIPAFWACVLGGYIPCPLALILNDPERWAKHLAHVNALLDRPLFITTAALLQYLPARLPTATLETLRAAGPHDLQLKAGISDPAVLMLTSGSTGNSKAVVLTHGNLLSSMGGKARRQRMSAADVTLNWIAFDHVAALLEVHMVSKYVAATQVHIEPAAILSDPLLFLRLISHHRVSIAFAPNFLLGQINTALEAPPTDESPSPALDLDLSCLRYIVTGGEANVVATGRRFLELLEPYGLARNALRPAFGMTETSAASIYSHEFPDGDADNEFASVGLPITGFEMRIVSEDGTAQPNGQPGELQVRGPMVFTRYHGNEKATRAAFTSDGWFRTGDLGRLERGRLSLVGRSKDSIIVSGVNYFSHELESALERLDGIERSFVAAFPTRPRGADTEQLVVAFAAVFSPEDEARLHQLVTAIRNATVLLWGFRPALILPLPKALFPKTSLGKIQRSLLRKRLEAGELRAYVGHVAEVFRRQSGGYVAPAGPAEIQMAEIFSELFGIPREEVSATANFFDFGGTSLDIIKLRSKLASRPGLADLPLVHILQNPTLRALARGERAEYDPVIPLQLTGSKTPLFCVHPGVGEVLVYMSLASFFVNDRPFFALRARGFSDGEKHFETIEEMVSTYVAAIRRRQPHGPYAIAGYSFGGPIAFEIAKYLESEGEPVAFVGCIDETPFLAEPSSRLEGAEGPLHVAFLLELIDRRQLEELSVELRESQNPCEYLHCIAPRERLAELDLDLPKWKAWAALSRSLVVLGQSYVPSGSVQSMTVFYAQPLHGSKDAWLSDVRRWDRFTRTPSRFIPVAGEHHTLMGKQHVTAFQSVLRSELDRALDGR